MQFTINGTQYNMWYLWMYVYKFLIMLKHKKTRLLQETFKVKQIKIASRLIQAQGAGNQLSGIIIDY